jgi:hypothetical protein
VADIKRILLAVTLSAGAWLALALVTSRIVALYLLGAAWVLTGATTGVVWAARRGARWAAAARLARKAAREVARKAADKAVRAVVEPKRPAPRRPAPPASRWAVLPLVLVVVGIIAVAFRGSWGALRDAAIACHFDRDSADLYPFGVDGLLVVAILAAVMLRHDKGARRYTLGIIAGYTGASWYLNFLHGLGEFAADPVTGRVPVQPWPVVVVVASLVIGSLFLGSHLLIFVWRHVFPDAAPVEVPAEVFHDGTQVGDDVPDVPAPPASNVEAAKANYRYSLAPQYKTLSQSDLMNQFGINKREAGRVQSEVKAELADEAAAAAAPEPDGGTLQHSLNGQSAGPT